MDIKYVLDQKRRVAVDELAEVVIPVEFGSKREENIVNVIHYALQRLDQIGKEKYGPGAELCLKQIFMNDETLEAVTRSSMWNSLSDADDLTILGELYKMGTVHRMKTMPGSRVQLYIKVNDGGRYRHTLFGLIDIL